MTFDVKQVQAEVEAELNAERMEEVKEAIKESLAKVKRAEQIAVNARREHELLLAELADGTQ